MFGNGKGGKPSYFLDIDDFTTIFYLQGFRRIVSICWGYISLKFSPETLWAQDFSFAN